MKRTLCLLPLFAWLAGTEPLRADFLSVVEITDLRGNAIFRICTDAEKKALEDELRAEAKVYAKALQEAKADWKALYKDTPFPSSRIRARKLRVLTSTPNREEAEKYLSKREDHYEDALADDKREEERILKMKPTRSRRGRGSNAAYVRNLQQQVKEDRERDEHADKAEVLLRKRLAAAAGHEVPFYGETPVAANPAPKRK